MQQVTIVLFASLLVSCSAGNVNRHLKYLPDLDNSIESNSFVTKQMRKFVAITRRPSKVVYHPEGSSAELTCEGIGVPAPNIRWFKNDAPVYEHNLESYEVIDTNPTSLARVTSTLLIPKTYSQDTYTCVVSSSFKTAKASTTVYSTADGSTDATGLTKITLEPRILVSYKVFVDTIGKNVVLPCKARGHPRPHVTWVNNKGYNVTNDDKRMKVLRSGELVITPLSWSDMGEFTCQAENAFGSRNITTFVYPAKAG